MRLFVAITMLALFPVVCGAGEAAQSYPAVWEPHALIVDLHDLPKRYTCNELWYKFRDVLISIGAGADLKVLPYRCGPGAGALASSPRVELTFSLPREVSGKQAPAAQLRVRRHSIRLEPGKQNHLDDQDCALLEQMKEMLLPSIGSKVTDSHFACQAPRSSSSPPFSLTVAALIPATAPVGNSQS